MIKNKKVMALDIIVIFYVITLTHCLCLADFQTSYGKFSQALETDDIASVMKYGKEALSELEMKYYNDPGFIAFKSKLIASEFLAKKMNMNLIDARKKSLQNLFVASDKNEISVAPAKTYYEVSKKLFAKNAYINGLLLQEKEFLTRYYSIRLRTLTSDLAKSGQGLTVALPTFNGTYDYVLVLPLLHCLGGEPVSLETLPNWMKSKEHMIKFSESCLKHYGFPYQSMTISRSVYEKNNKKVFSEFDYYMSASKKCKTQLPSVAVECLKKAIDLVKGSDLQKEISLRFEVVKIWLDSENYILAAGYAKELSDLCKDEDKYADAVWNYYYALSRSNNIEAILSNIDEALSDNRCEKYHAKLTYIKWWSLKRSRSSNEQVMAVEHQLLEKYSDNPMVAPIMLSRATDFLARQEYRQALLALEKIVKKYPGTKAAEQAKRMQKKLNKVLNKES